MPMTTSLDQRLFGVAQKLLLERAYGTASEVPPPRNVVREQDAVEATVTLVALISEQVHIGCVTPDVGARMAAMLMVVRDYVRPLPPGIDANGRDLLTSDLTEMVAVIRALSAGS